jgi:hypothetical protein
MSDPYKVTPDTECDPIPLDMRRAVLQTAYTRTAKREHLENILRRLDRMLDKAETEVRELRQRADEALEVLSMYTDPDCMTPETVNVLVECDDIRAIVAALK